ncbi:MAG: FeoB-associated Cys-rich membrane protein [Clostridia bacterium]|nr:FeoB-associated Cys-rich membrane protein [Clostridia bacterium]
MENFIIIAIVVLIVAFAVAYIVKAKKKGAKCIGCPAGGNCSGNTEKNSSCSCGGCSCGCENSDIK